VLASLALSAAALRSRRLPANARVDRPRSTPLPAIASQAGAIQRVGVVQFNPYHDTGGEYSFSVALLDENGTGLLLTGLYHRDQSRVYAKEVRSWTSDQELMAEERQAIERAHGAEPL
jgi:uncharacterized protein DUF4446